jgi:DNA-binding CsgD family transcriptional regulator
LERFSRIVGPGLRLFEAYRLTALAEAARLRGADAPGAWQEAERSWLEIDAPYWAAYSRYRRAESALIAHAADRRTVTDWLSSADRDAIRLGARRLTADIHSLARRARIELDDDLVSTKAVATSVDPGNGNIGNGAALSAVHSTANGNGHHPHGLTARELEILGLLASGLTNRQIGQRLFISPKTAGVHVSNILGKLGVGGRVEAATVAQRMGLVPEDAGV